MPGPDAANADEITSTAAGLGISPAPPERLEALRGELQRRGLDGFLAPRTDRFMGEYMPLGAERVQWLTGFAGSAGFVGIAMTSAAIFIDGRYTLQVRDQVDVSRFTPRSISDAPVSDWITESFTAGQRVGYDPWLHTKAGLARLAQAADAAEIELVALDDNPIDSVWVGQPPLPTHPVFPHGIEFSGESSQSKCQRLAGPLMGRKIDAAIITASDSVAWLLNIRGSDVPNCPLALSYAILRADSTVAWFIDPAKVRPDTLKHLQDGVDIQPLDRFEEALEGLGADGATVLVDPAASPAVIGVLLNAAGADVVAGDDPCLLPKALKNEIEIEGTRIAHRRDGVALSRFLCWLDGAVENGGTSGELSELAVIDHLHDLRTQGERFRGPSFDTIAGFGSNGAIVHYRAAPDTNKKIVPGSLLLVDSGGQYDEGTTDVTRTIAIGPPSDEMRLRFTQVLKGHIAIARARFPKGVTGSQLDPLARAALWAAGVDYDHGTGHGVGSYLNVHEGPQRISKSPSTTALDVGMIVSNEPGYYKTDGFGIRIENLVAVFPVIDRPAGAEKELLGFETLTLAPIDRRLIQREWLDAGEVMWLDDYHARVLEEIGPLADPETRAWLEGACAPI